jgi:hypothetical protein
MYAGEGPNYSRSTEVTTSEVTKKRVLILHISGFYKVEAYVDASFAAHEDGKSHTGKVF